MNARPPRPSPRGGDRAAPRGRLTTTGRRGSDDRRGVLTRSPSTARTRTALPGRPRARQTPTSGAWSDDTPPSCRERPLHYMGQTEGRSWSTVACRGVTGTEEHQRRGRRDWCRRATRPSDRPDRQEAGGCVTDHDLQSACPQRIPLPGPAGSGSALNRAAQPEARGLMNVTVQCVVTGASLSSGAQRSASRCSPLGPVVQSGAV